VTSPAPTVRDNGVMNRSATVVAATAAVVIGVTGGALGAAGTTRLSHQDALDSARSSALASAKQIAVDIAEYDYRHIDADFTRVTHEATGKFLKDFGTSANGVRDAIVAVKAVSTAQVASAGVVDVAPSSAQVVVALNRVVTNSQAPKGTTSAFGLQMFLVRKGNRWLASAVNPL
jgi:Mce-associated membrane protein